MFRDRCYTTPSHSCNSLFVQIVLVFQFQRCYFFPVFSNNNADYGGVFYSNKYYIYINDNPSSGISPTNSSYWCELDLKGEKGADGIGVDFKGTWDSSVTYTPLDGVYYNGVIWCCKTSNTNQIPSISSSYWESVVEFHKAKIISSTIEPTDKYNGLIWMEMSLIS